MKKDRSTRTVEARVVQMQYPSSIQATWALQFESGGRRYYLTKNPFLGRRLFSDSDAIAVANETAETVSLPYKVAMTAVLDEQVRRAIAAEVEPFIARHGDWFRNPVFKKRA